MTDQRSPSPMAVMVPHKIAFALAALILAGCSGGEPPEDFVVIGPTGRALEDHPLYCYRTLAGADCYAERLEGPPNRLIRGYEPVVADPRSISE